MPLHGKIVVIKRSGGDGTEFPLTATCLFGRKPDCDIRIQLPQVSKEHCRIDLNENKEVILTNLSSVNPTLVNGEVLQQSERLKHGDLITIIDRSFRFEYPPAPTPKKRSSTGGKVLQDQQVGDTITVETDEKRISQVSQDLHFKDGTNNDNIQRCLEKTVEMESKEDDSLPPNKSTSPFGDLYQMIKKSLDVNTPLKSTSLLQTPSSRFCTPKPGSVRKNVGHSLSTKEKSTTKKDKVKDVPGTDESKGQADSLGCNGTPSSVKKKRNLPTTEMAGPTAEEAETLHQKKNSVTPPKFTVCEVIEQIAAQKSHIRRRSKESTPGNLAVTMEQEQQAVTAPPADHLQKASQRTSGIVEKEMSRKRRSRELPADLPKSQMKKKRVSFGGYLSPELFDKRLPPDSPLRKGAAPRRSLCLSKIEQSLLRRRASVIGTLKEFEDNSSSVQSLAKLRTPSPKKSSNAKNASPKTPTPAKKSPKSKTPSPKTPTPAKKSPKSKTPSPKAASPAKKSPKSKTPSPKAASPAKKSPKSKTPSPKAASPAKKSPKSKTPSPKTPTPAKKSPKSKTPSPKTPTPAKKSPKSKTPSPKTPTPAKKSPKSKTPLPKTPTPAKNSPKAKTPLNPGVQGPTVQGRFSVSRINTPSPFAEDAVSDQLPSITVTPKIPLRRESMKSTSRKTKSVSKSAVKVMLRRSGISRASMKAMNSWADIVKFGQTKTQVAAATKRMVTTKPLKKTLSKPRTPARKVSGHVSTGHADSPVTIVVGKACKRQVVHSTGAAPRVITNFALYKKDMKMDEDMTGISEMFKTPVNERKRKSVINDSSVIQTPVESLGMSVVEPSVLTTPEEPGEMMVSPLSVESTVKRRQYNSEAVQRLLNVDQESSFVSDVPALVSHSNSSPQQKPELQECLVKRTPKQKAEPVEDIRGKRLTTPQQKREQKECLTGVKRIMKTPKQKAEPVEDIRGKLMVTPQQKQEQKECLTGVKRIMKTPKQKAEPVEDIRGKLLVTPQQKHEQEECLTGVKRIMKTPKQEAGCPEDLKENLQSPKFLEGGVSLDGAQELLETPRHMQESQDLKMADMKTPNMKSSPVVCLTGIKRIMKTPKERSAPVEDMVGVKRLMKTPREKSKPVEYNFGIKRLMKSPRLRGKAPIEDFEGLQKLLEVPLTEPTMEPNEVEVKTQLDGGLKATEEIDVHEEPQDSVSSHVINSVPAVDMPKALNTHMEEATSGHDNNESLDAIENIPQAAIDGDLPLKKPKVQTNLSKEQPEVKTKTPTSNEYSKKSIQSKRAKAAQSKAAEDKQEATEHSEDLVIPAPVRGRRWEKTKTTAPPTVRQTRNRSIKNTESEDAKLAMEKSTSQPSKAAVRPKRGKNIKTVSEDQAEINQVPSKTEMIPAADLEQDHSVNIEHQSNICSAPLEKALLKPQQGRKTKQVSEQSQSVPCTVHDEIPKADITEDAKEVCSDQLEVVSNGNKNKKAVPQAPQTESLPVGDAAFCKETDLAVTQKKSVRGRKVKFVESKPAEDKQEAKPSEESALPALARGKRGNKTEATTTSAVRQTTRNRIAKSLENTPDQHEILQEKALQTLVTEISAKATNEQILSINTSQEENYLAAEAVMKPKERKTKTPVDPLQSEPKKNEAVSEQHLVADAQPEQLINIVGKPRRERKTKPGTVKLVAEDTVVTVDTKQETQPAGRAKRGRNSQQEDTKIDNNGKTTSTETTKSEGPVKKLRRTRKADQDNVEEKREEIQSVKMVVVDESEASIEAMKTNEQPTVAAKPRRGGRKAKQGNETETPVESMEIQKVPAVCSTDKCKQGRRGKQVIEEPGITTEAPEEKLDQKLEAEDKNKSASVFKSSRVMVGKIEVSQTMPIKRTRRGTALLCTGDSTHLVSESSESALKSTEPAKKGRRAAAKTTDNVTVSSDPACPPEDLYSVAAEDSKVSKRSVKWKADLEVFEIPKVKTGKAVGGRKSKLGYQLEAENKNVSNDANKSEEEDLSDKIAETLPVKRARRGARVAEKAESSNKVDPRKDTEAETQPKVRRGRSAKK
ncbi:proliferation marker protein Ki-67 isoform X2 [Channa argus]|uniref:proliferation marker protein Ki-67 isoform X2 n=1 Tax=Channa argus TaxID=215402 RepID=UPI0035217784